MTPRRFPYRVLLLGDDDSTPAWTPDELYVSERMKKLMIEGLREQGHDPYYLPILDTLEPLKDFDPQEWLVFNWIEEYDGRPWPEADIAEELEKRGYVYSGATAEVIRLTHQRDKVKERLHAAGLPILPGRVLAEEQAGEWEVFPAIVKGVGQHASNGLTRDSVVYSTDELAARIRWLRERVKDRALVEPFADGREFHVAVWGNKNPEALWPVELDYSIFDDPRDRVYSDAWKFDLYSRGYKEIKMPCPAPADDPALQKRLMEIAVEAHKVIGLRDYSRMDMRMWGDEPAILDVNANPDLDITSMHPIAAQAMGLTYGQMAARIIEYAAERWPA